MSGYSVPGATGAGYGYDQFSEAEPLFPDSYDRPFPQRKVMVIDTPPSPKETYSSIKNAKAKLESKQNAMLNAAAEAAANAVKNESVKPVDAPLTESFTSKKGKKSRKEHLTDFNDSVIKLFPQDLVIIFVVFIIIIMCISILRSLSNIQHSLRDLAYMNMMLISQIKKV